MTITVLDPEKVNAIFHDCLFKGDEDDSKHIKAESMTSVKFHSERLNGHKVEIEAMLDHLPDGFKKSVGGGMSFLSACDDRHGNQWTGFHQRLEQLFQLGIGIGKAELLVPREMWGALPGGMPYYVVN